MNTARDEHRHDLNHSRRGTRGLPSQTLAGVNIAAVDLQQAAEAVASLVGKSVLGDSLNDDEPVGWRHRP